MADLINPSNSYYDSKNKHTKAITWINSGSQISLYPLYGENNSYTGDETITLPIAPSDIMFSEDSNPTTINLLNYGEVGIGMNKKLASWTIESFFPARTKTMPIYSNSGMRGYTTGENFKYWFDISSGTEDPYKHYCSKLLTWKKEETPLVFFFNMNGWGDYYNCQIKSFKYGRKDPIGNVYYQLDFQEYKECIQFDKDISTDYTNDTYIAQEGENILQICKKVYGDSDKWQYFMDLNGMSNPLDITVGKEYKVK